MRSIGPAAPRSSAWLSHLSWDLADFRLVSPMLPFSPPMRLLSHAVASAFLALVGVSLALAHRDRLEPARLLAAARDRRGRGGAGDRGELRLRSWRGDLVRHPPLHRRREPFALPLVEAPASVSLVAGAARSFSPLRPFELFDPPALLWLGLGDALPNTVDWRPLLPWAGVVLVGLGLARLPGVMERLTSPGRWRAKSGALARSAFAGRHSLVIYLVHQPILFRLVWRPPPQACSRPSRRRSPTSAAFSRPASGPARRGGRPTSAKAPANASPTLSSAPAKPNG